MEYLYYNEDFNKLPEWLRELWELSPRLARKAEESLSLPSAMPCYAKDQVIEIVAKFARSYDTGVFLNGDETLENTIEEIKDLIDWDVANKA